MTPHASSRWATLAASATALITGACSHYSRYDEPYVHATCPGPRVQATATGCISSTPPNPQQVLDMNRAAQQGGHDMRQALQAADLSGITRVEDLHAKLGVPEDFTPAGRTNSERTASIIAEMKRDLFVNDHPPHRVMALRQVLVVYEAYLKQTHTMATPGIGGR